MERFMRSMIDQLNLSMKSGAATQISPDSQKQKQPENPYSKQINDLEEKVKKLSKEVASSLDKFHPIGSIYCSEDPTEPETLFGGTWERIKDRFLLAAGSSYKAGDTGGEATHKLSRNEIPNYRIGFMPAAVPSIHGEWNNGGIAGAGMSSSGKTDVVNDTDFGLSDTQYGWDLYTDGGDESHNNMPPYLAVYVWKRTA